MSDADRPNIVFVFSDQQRWDTLGCYGQPLEVTPNLDRMAGQGVRFENAFTPQPVCGPARSCLQTGKYAAETGCFRNAIALPEKERTIAHQFSEAGFEVGYIGKWHLASTEGLAGVEDVNNLEGPVPFARRGGWKDFWLASDILEFTSHGFGGHMWDTEGKKREFEGYRVDCVTDFALDYLRTRDGQRPFFLFLSYIEPHHQNNHKHYEGPPGSKERFRDFVVPGDLEGQDGDWREEYPDYLGCCASLDSNLGRIRAELDELGLAGNTLVVYASDHGSHFRTRNREYKRAPHDACLRIPMIACGPGFTGGKVVKELTSLIDIPPTFLTAGGIEPPGYMRGRPLQALVEETAAGWPQEIFAQISESQVGRCVRTHKWKYSVSAPPSACPGERPGWLHPGSGVYVEEFLYDLEADPHERDNLVREPSLAGVRAELAGRLKKRMVEAGEREPEIRPA